MSDYGVTDRGFVLKRMDTILEEIHSDLTEGFGVDTRLEDTSFLNTLVMTFAGQIADLWETAQDSYYAKYPATAAGVNLDNAVQYGGIRRMPNKRTCYPLHCTGEDGALIREEAVVATNTMPEIRLYSAGEFQITREKFNRVSIKVAVVESSSVYSVTINGNQYRYSNAGGSEREILRGLKEAVINPEYIVELDESNGMLKISDTVASRSNVLILSDNLTTGSVTTIANFLTQEYGRITLPDGIITKMINNIAGFTEVTNRLEPSYGRLQETDIELRHSYLAKSALRSNTMIDSIIAELLNYVPGVESASGYENDTDHTDERGLPPHSIEIVVEGGKDTEIAQAILKRKAGGIQTYGKIQVDAVGSYGDSVPIRFNRPEYLYVWLKIVLYGEAGRLPANYAKLTIDALMKDSAHTIAGEHMLIQLLTKGIYDAIAGITYVEIYAAYSNDKNFIPESSDYCWRNILVTTRQKVILDQRRIEVSFCADKE